MTRTAGGSWPGLICCGAARLAGPARTCWPAGPQGAGRHGSRPRRSALKEPVSACIPVVPMPENVLPYPRRRGANRGVNDAPCQTSFVAGATPARTRAGEGRVDMNLPGPAPRDTPTENGQSMKNGSDSKLTQNPHAVREQREKNLEVAIGRQVRDLRKRQRMTGSELAQQTGLSVGMLSKIENGVISPSLNTLQALAAAAPPDERQGGPILAVLDARRDQLYGQFFDENGDPAGDPFAAAAESIPDRLERIFGDGTPLLLVGSGTELAAHALDQSGLVLGRSGRGTAHGGPI